jgi:hypothetical protein
MYATLFASRRPVLALFACDSLRRDIGKVGALHPGERPPVPLVPEDICEKLQLALETGRWRPNFKTAALNHSAILPARRHP